MTIRREKRVFSDFIENSFITCFFKVPFTCIVRGSQAGYCILNVITIKLLQKLYKMYKNVTNKLYKNVQRCCNKVVNLSNSNSD